MPALSDTVYEVLDIVRLPNVGNADVKSTFIFKLVLFNGEVSLETISPQHYDRLVKGGLFRGDFVRITHAEDGVGYEVVDPQTPCDVEFVPDGLHRSFLNDIAIMPARDIPLLAVTLPAGPTTSQRCQSSIGEIVTVDGYIAKKMHLPIIGRVLYRSRIASYRFSAKSAHCFQIVLQGTKNLKVKFWGDHASYHPCMVPGELVVIEEHRRTTSERWETYLVYNSFHEDLYLNCIEINVNRGAVYRADLIVPYKLAYPNTPLKHALEGTVTYMSVLMRHRTKWEAYIETHGMVYEYCLLKVGGEMVILYSNSTPEFGDLEVGMVLRIENLRMYVRGDTHQYLSTIYTEISILTSNSADDSDLIQGALGFVPDKGASMETFMAETTETFQVGKKEREVTIVPLWKPEFVLITDLDRIEDTLVFNETRKYAFKAKLLGYNFANFSEDSDAVRNWTPVEFYSISYLRNTSVCEQRCALIRVGIDDVEKTLFLFKNYFSSNDVLVERAGMCKTMDELASKVNTWFNFVVDVFRASESVVLTCLSQAFAFPDAE